MARRTAPIGSVDVGDRFGLPLLPRLDIVLHSSATDARTRSALRTLAGRSAVLMQALHDRPDPKQRYEPGAKQRIFA